MNPSQICSKLALLLALMAFTVALSPSVVAQVPPVCGTITGANTPPGPSFNNYLAGTRKCSIGIAGTTSTGCQDIAGLEATFSIPLSVSLVPNGWATWSTPPFSESSTPIVGFTNFASSLTVTLPIAGAAVLGLEVEPNSFATFPITATFKDNTDTSLFSITQSVTGLAGARIFAGVCTQQVIHSVTITAPAGAGGFAIAQVRSDQFTGPALFEPPITASPTPAPPAGATSNVK